MKVLKFQNYLVPLVLSGEKDSTWRLFDDKDLSVGDVVELREFVTESLFGIATLSAVSEKPFSELSTQDKQGHEGYETDEDMYATYSKYYRTTVGPDTPLKIIRFSLHK